MAKILSVKFQASKSSQIASVNNPHVANFSPLYEPILCPSHDPAKPELIRVEIPSPLAFPFSFFVFSRIRAQTTQVRMGSKYLTTGNELLAGSVGGAAQVLVGQPLDTIKTRAQIAPSLVHLSITLIYLY